jgi:hypothetical protein
LKIQEYVLFVRKSINLLLNNLIRFYFGIGGGTLEFMDFVKNLNVFSIEVVKELNNGISNIRQILEIRHINK